MPVKRSHLAVIALVFLCFQSVRVWSAETYQGKTPPEWLRAMINATQNVSYRGLLKYQQGQEGPTVFKVTSGIIEGRRLDRLVHLGKQYREIIRHGSDLIFILNSGDELFNQFSARNSFELFNQSFTKMFSNLPDYYQARIGSVSNLGKHELLEVQIVPEDSDRYGYKLWLDTESGLLLKFEISGPEKDSLESFAFVDIEINVSLGIEDLKAHPSKNQIKLQMKVDETPVEQEIAKSNAPIFWYPTWLPSGFSVATENGQNALDEVMLQNMSYSDGLAVFSIYVEKLPGELATGIASDYVGNVGGTVTVVRQVQDSDSISYMVMVVGEIPEITALQVAQSVAHRDNINSGGRQDHPGSSPDSSGTLSPTSKRSDAEQNQSVRPVNLPL